MFTKCPECKTIQKISASQLRSGKGMVQCQKCYGIFYGLDDIGETAGAIKSNEQADEPLFGHPEPVAKKTYWAVSSALALCLLIGQLAYFEGARLTQNPAPRLWLEKICQPIHCQLPVYQNLQDFSVMQGQLSPLADNTINFQTAISNQAAFAQNFPNLKLSLLDYAGNVFALRVFHPQEYLANASEAILLADASAEINLKIVAPNKPIGGYTFDLTN